jgi:hypothetical protein
MININYLNHSLVFSSRSKGSYIFYNCEKCSGLFWWDIDNVFYYYDRNDGWIGNELTCDEFLIKKIIE